MNLKKDIKLKSKLLIGFCLLRYLWDIWCTCFSNQLYKYNSSHDLILLQLWKTAFQWSLFDYSLPPPLIHEDHTVWTSFLCRQWSRCSWSSLPWPPPPWLVPNSGKTSKCQLLKKVRIRESNCRFKLRNFFSSVTKIFSRVPWILNRHGKSVKFSTKHFLPQKISTKNALK